MDITAKMLNDDVGLPPYAGHSSKPLLDQDLQSPRELIIWDGACIPRWHVRPEGLQGLSHKRIDVDTTLRSR